MLRVKGWFLCGIALFTIPLFAAPQSAKSLEEYLVRTLRIEEPERFILNIKLKKQIEQGFGTSAVPFNPDGTVTEAGKAALLEKFSPISAPLLERIFVTLGRTDYPNTMLIGPSGSGKSFTLNQLAILLSFGVVPPFLEYELGIQGNDSPFLALLREHYLGKTQIMKINYDLLSRDNTRDGAAYAKADVRMRAILVDLFETAKKEFRTLGRRTIFIIEEAATLPDLVQQTLKEQLDETGFKAHSKNAVERGSEAGYSIIGLTTPGEYRQMVGADSAIERRYVKTLILEPSEDKVLDILLKKRAAWTELHGLEITDETLIFLISMRKFFANPPLAMPDSVLKIVDNLFSWASKPDHRKNGKVITIDEAYEFLVRHNHLPTSVWLRDDQGRAPLWNLEQKLNELVIAQEAAVKLVSKRLKAGRPTGFREVPVFIILGPSGAGKDTLAKAINKVMFGHDGSHLKFDLAGSQNSGLKAILEGPSIGSASDNQPPLLIKAFEEGAPHGLIVLNEAKDMPSDHFNMLKVVIEDGVIRPRGRDTRERPLGLNAIFIMGQWGEELFEGKSDAQVADIVASTGEPELIRILQQGSNNGRNGAVPKALIDRAIRSGGLVLMPPVPKSKYVDIVRLNLKSIVELFEKRSNIQLDIENSLMELVAQIAIDNKMGPRGLDGILKDLTETAISEAIDQGLPERGIKERMTIKVSSPAANQVEVARIDGGQSVQKFHFHARDLVRARCQSLLSDD